MLAAKIIIFVSFQTWLLVKIKH